MKKPPTRPGKPDLRLPSAATSKHVRSHSGKQRSIKTLQARSLSSADQLGVQAGQLEEVTMALKSLKLDFNRVKEENTRYKTRNA